MLIRSIRLSNVKSHKELQLKFSPGVNAIMGANGAGKSTVVEAIGFALFDALSYKEGDFLREGEKSGSVWLTFVSRRDGRDYLVERSVKGKVFRVSDCESGSLLTRDAADATAFIRSHLGLDPTADLSRLFTDAVGVEQGTLTAAFHLTAAPRKAVFDPLLQVNDYREAFSALLPTVQLLQNRAHDLEVSIAALRSRVDELPAARKRAADAERELHESEGLLAVSSKSLTEAESERDRHETSKLALQRAEVARQLAAQQEATAAEDLRRAEAELAAALEAARIVHEAQGGYATYVAALERKRALDTEVKQRQALQEERGRLRQQQARAQADYDMLTQRLAEMADAEQRADSLRPAAERQQTLTQQRDEAQIAVQELRHTQQALDSAQGLADQESARHADLSSRLAEAQAIHEQIAALELGLNAAIAKLESATEQLNMTIADGKAAGKHVEELEAGGDLCPFCGQEISDEHRVKLLAEANAVLKSHREVYSDAKKAKGAAEEARKAAEDRREQLRRQLQGAPTQIQVENAAAQLLEAERRRDEAAARVAALAQAPARLESLKAELATLGDPLAARSLALAQLEQRESTQGSLKEAETRLGHLAGKLATLEHSLAPLADLDARVDATDDELSASQAAYSLVLTNRALAESVPQRKQDHAGRAEHLAQARSALQQAMATQADAEAAYNAQAHDQALQAVNKLSEAVGSLTARVELHGRTLAESRTEIATLEAKEESLRKEEDLLEQLREQKRVVDRMRAVIRDAGPRITRLRVARISDLARQIFSELTNDYSQRLKWDEEYAITLEVDGRERPFKNLSGGEQMVAALAVRLALTREMSSLRVAFFDEPTANLDPERRAQLATHITNIQGFDQVFVISHDDTFESSTANPIRLQKQRGATQLAAD